MTSSSNSEYGQTSNRIWGGCRGQGDSRCGNWSGINVAAMIAGFIIFWPLGLLILFSNMSGRDVRELPGALRNLWTGMTSGWQRNEGFGRTQYSDNEVFNEYQQTQYDRIHEIKEEIKARSHRFKEFRENLKRRAHEDEFNRFMADRPGNRDF